MRKRGIPVRDSKNYKDWLISAEEDLLSAGANYNEELYRHCCILSHQAVEKALKSYLIYVQGGCPPTHNIKRLLSLCIKYDEDFSYFRGADEIFNEHYLSIKYPSKNKQEFDRKETMGLMRISAEICGFVEDKIEN